MLNLFVKLKNALSKTRSYFGDKLRTLFSRPLDAATLEEIEKTLYEADLGVATATALTAKLQAAYRQHPEVDLMAVLKQELLALLPPVPPLSFSETPFTILIVGVNGNGKTTSTAKLAHLFKSEGKSVLLGAADTFRAAAVEQLAHWAEKAGVDIVRGQQGSDPAAVAFDTLTAAKARKTAIVLIDTAGRLHTKTALMQELEKMRRTCQKVLPGSPHETFLVLDATTGQNGLDQARTFMQFTPVTGLILTKIDGSAKGGIVFQIAQQLKIPVRFIGVGEGMEDLQEFDPKTFAESILS